MLIVFNTIFKIACVYAHDVNVVFNINFINPFAYCIVAIYRTNMAVGTVRFVASYWYYTYVV